VPTEGEGKAKWSSQAVRLKARGSVDSTSLSQSAICYLEEFKAELNLYAAEIASVFPVSKHAVDGSDGGLWTEGVST
jgi:hypothetical protein